MRVLFAVNPGSTVFYPLVPIAWALRTAGHDVRVASQPRFAETIVQAGLTAVPVGRDRDPNRLMAAAGVTTEALQSSRAGLPPPWDSAVSPEAADWDSQLAAWETFTNEVFRLEGFPIAADLVDLARTWRPHLVVWEPWTAPGPIAARLCGAASVRVLYGADVFAPARARFLQLRDQQPAEARHDPYGQWLNSWVREAGGFEESMVTGHVTVDPFPASLQLDADVTRLRTRYVAYNGASVVPRWLWDEPARPRVAVTLGFTATQLYGGYTIDVGDTLRAVGDLDVEVVATISAAEQPKLGTLPDNVRVESFVPLSALAPTCAAVVHHGGAGTVGSFLPHGVPHLSLPCNFDEPFFAHRLAECGAGLVLDTDEATPAAIREGVRRLLEDPALRAGARELQAEHDALPAPTEIVPALEEAARRFSTVPDDEMRAFGATAASEARL